MKKYIAILRGINVSGKNKIRMADLKSSFEKEGFQNVLTYIQSGNILFDTVNHEDEDKLAKSIHDLILNDFGYDVPVIITTPKEINYIIENNPFLKKGTSEISPWNIEPIYLHVTFLEKAPVKDKAETLIEKKYSPDHLVIQGKYIFLYCPGGYGKTKLSNNYLEKSLGIPATTRNWKSINKFRELSEQTS